MLIRTVIVMAKDLHTKEELILMNENLCKGLCSCGDNKTYLSYECSPPFDGLVERCNTCHRLS